jgi:hypothetical protein
MTDNINKVPFGTAVLGEQNVRCLHRVAQLKPFTLLSDLHAIVKFVKSIQFPA